MQEVKLTVGRYSETKPHRAKRLLWCALNATVFRALPRRARLAMLRVFGAKFKYGQCNATACIYAPWNLECDTSACIGPGVEIYNKDKVYIGHLAVISQGAYLCTASHDIRSKGMTLVTKPIRIGSQAWIAAKAIVLPGVTIGEGAVVGAGAVVSKDVPPWSIAVGNPARVVGKREIRE